MQRGQTEPRGPRRMNTGGTYRTVCVRLCDGFYWPISHSTTPNRFVREIKQCEQACPSRARLFVHRTSDEEPAAIRHLDGPAYPNLENAFRFRREYVAECTCRANPWDEASTARHRAYAEAAKGETTVAQKSPSAQKTSNEPVGRSQKWARDDSHDRAANDD